MIQLPTQRRAEEFARALEGATTAGPAVAPLVALAHTLQSLPVGPAPEFRDSLRQRLVAVASVQAMAEPAAASEPTYGDRARVWVARFRTRRALAFATSGLAAVIALSGIAVSTSRSLPGDPFYGMKRTAEAVQMDLTHGDFSRGKLQLAFARTRLDEVRRLVLRDARVSGRAAGPSAAGVALDRSTTADIVKTLADMDKETVAGTRDLTTAYRSQHRRDALVILDRFAREQQARLAALLPALPASARAHGEHSLNLLKQVDARAGQLLTYGACTDCGTAGSPGTDQLGVQPGSGAGAGTGGQSGGSSLTPSGTPTTAPLPGGTQTGTGTTGGDGGLGGVVGNLPSTTTSPVPLPTSSPLPLLSPSASPLPSLDTSTLTSPLSGTLTSPLSGTLTSPLSGTLDSTLP